MSKEKLTFLADESCDFNIVRYLRNAGYSVVSIAELCPGNTDEKVLQICKFKLISESCHSSMLLAGIQEKPVDISLWMPDKSAQA